MLGVATRQVTLKLAKPAQQLPAKCGEVTALQHSAGTFSHSWVGQPFPLLYLLDTILEEDDVRRAPHGGGHGTVALAGYDDLEKIRRSRQIGHEFLVGIGRQRLRDRQVFENRENEFIRGSKRSIHTCAAKFQQRVAFVKVPGQAGADRYGALEVLACNDLRQPGLALLRK